MSKDETVSIPDVTVKLETDKALLCIIEDEEIWMPKSQIDPDSEVFEKGTEGTLVITKWIAQQKNLGG